MVSAQPFAEALGAMGLVRYLDVEGGGDGEVASVKEFVPLTLFRAIPV